MDRPDALTAALETPLTDSTAERPGNPYRVLALEVVGSVVKDLTKPSENIGSDPDEARAWLYCEAYRDVRERWCDAAGVSVHTLRRAVEWPDPKGSPMPPPVRFPH